MRTIAIANQKGGCGKTTTAVNLAAALAEKGNRTLIVDLDPQGHTTLGFGYDPDALEKSVYDVLINQQVPISKVIISTKFDLLDLAPSNVLLSGAELELAAIPGKELVLAKQLQTINNEYDICVIDCPPSIGMLTLNALIASTDVIVPVQVHYYAMEGLKQLFETANIIRENFYPNTVRILGLLLTFVENTTIFSRQIQQQMREFFGSLVFDTVIHKTVRLAEAPSAGEPVLTYAPKSRGTEEYRALADEIINGRPLASEKMSDDETAEEKISIEKVMVEETSDDEVMVEETSDDEATVEQMSNDEATVEETSDDEVMVEQTSDDEATVEQMSNDETVVEQMSNDEATVEEMSNDEVMVEEMSNDEATVEQMSDDEATVEQMSDDETAEEKISAEEVMVEEMNDGKE